MTADPIAAVLGVCSSCNRPSWLAPGSLTCDECAAADLVAVADDGDGVDAQDQQPECPACGRWLAYLMPESGCCRSCTALGLDRLSPRSWSAPGGFGRSKRPVAWPTRRAKKSAARQRRRKAERNTQDPRADRPANR